MYRWYPPDSGMKPNVGSSLSPLTRKREWQMEVRSSSPGAVRFKFTKKEIAESEQEGRERCERAKRKRLRGRSGGPDGGTDLRIDILGSAGEMAVASFLGKKEGLFSIRSAIRDSIDIPPDIDVKTGAKHSYRLIVHLDDKPTKKFVLVTIEGLEDGRYDTIIHGWILGKDAMQRKYVCEPVPGRRGYFVPQKDLRPISELRDEQEAEE